MGKVVLTDLEGLDFSIINIKAHYHYWNNGASWETRAEGRRNSGIMCFIGCAADYYRDGELVCATQLGDVLLLPRGARYTCVFRDCQTMPSAERMDNFYVNGEPTQLTELPRHTAVNLRFDLVNTQGELLEFSPELLKFDLNTERQKNVRELLEQLVKSKRCHHELRSKRLLYQLIELLISSERSKDTENRDKLQPALDYIDENFSQQIDIPALAERCHMSVSTFRNNFKVYTGKTPKEYLLNRLVAAATDLLVNGVSVKETAEVLGFRDVGYFCRVYKQKTGTSPGKATKRTNE